MVQIVDVYVFVLATTAVLSLGVAFAAWMQRAVSRAWPVVVLMLGVTAWCGSEAVMWSRTSLAQQALWLKLTYPGVSVAIVGFVLFASDIAELDAWRRVRGILLVSLPLAMICIMAMANPGALFYSGYTAQRIGSYTHYMAQNGPLFWVYILVAWGMFLVGVFLVVRAHIRSTPAKRAQTTIVLIAAAFPSVISVLNQVSPVQVEGIESTAFFITGVLFLLALVRGQLLHPSGNVVSVREVVEAERREQELQTTNRELGDKLEASQDLADRLHDQATHDPLTNLGNRRSLQESLVREVARAQRTGEPIAFLIFDLDDFKAINDTYSHLAGDAALRMVSEVLLRCSRQVDIMCRWGGDEFVVVMPGADVDTAYRRAEELRDQIGGTLIHFDAAEFGVTTTIGVSVFPTHGDTVGLAIHAADQALFVAKERGGGHIAMADANGPQLASRIAERDTGDIEPVKQEDPRT